MDVINSDNFGEYKKFLTSLVASRTTSITPLLVYSKLAGKNFDGVSFLIKL